MAANHIRRSSSLPGLALGIALAAGISSAQNASIGSESGLDRAMQHNTVKKDDMMRPNGAVKVSKAEEAAYKALLAAQSGDPGTRIKLGEDFVSKFPSSTYLSSIYGLLTSSYFAIGNTDKMFAAGNRAIQLDPGNVDVMSLLAMAIPRRVKATTPDGAEQLQTAETFAHRAIEMIPAMKKPAGLDDALFERAKNDKLALAHSGLGLIDFNRQEYDDARAELTQAVHLASTPDPVDYYLLGNTDMQGSYYREAADAYEKCSVAGPLAPQCESRAASAKHDAETKLGR